MIKLYDLDIYKDFARNVLKNDDRKEAKIFFYRYMYGDKTLNASVLKYFDNFPKLNKFIKSVELKAIKEGKIGTKEGNFRLILDEDIYHWALSHKIQATASLIFKKALIKVAKEVPEADFLIPMHDGAVYQLDEFNYEHNKNRIEEIFKATYKEMCPNIEPRVHSKTSFI